MNSFLDWYQHLPSKVSPFIYEGDFFSLRWYSMGYVLAFLTTYFLAVYRLRKERVFPNITPAHVDTFVLLCLFGVIFGGRLGYILFYSKPDWDLSIIKTIFLGLIPFEDGKFTGFSGMSYHGGLVGVVLVLFLFDRVYKEVNNIDFANLIIPGIALGYSFGRLGNFMNGELYGRVTEMPWGMYFHQSFGAEETFLRHPSQLYESFFEGFLPFLILWFLRNNKTFRSYLAPMYMGMYGVARVFIEFFRQPDPQFRDENDRLGTVLGFLTMGQVLCLLMIGFSIFLIFYFKRRQKKGTGATY